MADCIILNRQNALNIYRVDLTFVQGNINSSSGANSTSSQSIRIRTNDYYEIDVPGYGFDIDIPDGFRTYIYYYNTSKKMTGHSTWVNGNLKITLDQIPANTKYVRFVVSLTANTALTPSDLPRTLYFRKRFV